MGLSFMHMVVLCLVVLVVFGTGRVPAAMGDLGRGLRNFTAGLRGESPPTEDLEKTRARLADPSDTCGTS